MPPISILFIIIVVVAASKFITTDTELAASRLIFHCMKKVKRKSSLCVNFFNTFLKNIHKYRVNLILTRIITQSSHFVQLVQLVAGNLYL